MNKTVELLGDKAEYLLSHTCKTIDKSTLHLPSPHTVEEVWAASDRKEKIRSCRACRSEAGFDPQQRNEKKGRIDIPIYDENEAVPESGGDDGAVAALRILAVRRRRQRLHEPERVAVRRVGRRRTAKIRRAATAPSSPPLSGTASFSS